MKMDEKVILDSKYWDSVAKKFDTYYIVDYLAEYKGEQYTELVKKWLNQKGNVLKTDLFEEAFGNDNIIFSECLSGQKRYGIDISPSITEIARGNSAKYETTPPHFMTCDVRSLPFKECSFDAVISSSTLDHFPEIESAMKELYRILKKEGVLILTLNNGHNPIYYLNFKLYNIFNWKGYYDYKCYTTGEIQKLAEKVGFNVETHTGIVFIPFLIPTVARICNNLNIKISEELVIKFVRLFSKVVTRNKQLRLVNGWYIAFKLKK